MTYPIVEVLLHQGTREEAQELVDFATTAEDVSSSDDANVLPKKHPRTISPVLELKKLYNKKEPSTVVNISKKHSQEKILPVFASSSSSSTFLNSSIKRIKRTIPKKDNEKIAALSDTSLHLSASSPSKTRRKDFSEAPPLPRSANKSFKTPKNIFADCGAGFKEMTTKQFQYVMFMKMEKLEENQTHIMNMLASLIDGDELDANVGVEDLQPLSSIEEFDLEEIKLENKTYRNKKKMAIKAIGGKDVRAKVRLGLDALMVRSVQDLFSKDGKTGKRAFSKTMHYRCLLRAFLDPTKNLTKDLIDFNVGDLLKRAVRSRAGSLNEES
ncbi:uncharacterized protein LOC136081613 [Hydra vulgaris]|uniref:Uncharacterized protein LOC136081613 n=1 Tax=Hydra vulgaris TaxID=6087 RepID=A0ABM4C0W9_HYDVU